MKEISVVIPVYNVKKYLRTCIDSVLNQSFRDFEMILVDDGSTDGCSEICDEYGKKDTRIVVVHQRNGGLSDARNTGLSLAHGKYVTFVDSDDILMPNMLELLHNLIVQEEAQIACCEHVRCEEDENLNDVVVPRQDKDISAFSEQKMREFLRGNNIKVVAWSKLYCMDLFSGIRYPKGRYHEDVFTTYKLVHAAKKIVTTNEVGYIYRKNRNSITGSFSPKRLDLIDGKLEQAKFVKENYKDAKLYELACAAVIYACNQCVYQMGQSGYSNLKQEMEINSLYHKYVKHYLKSKSSIFGKMYAIIACVDLKSAKKMAYCLKKR